MICAGFQKLLEPQYEVMGSVGDGLALLQSGPELKPDLILLDVGTPPAERVKGRTRVEKADDERPLVFLTMNPDPEVAAEASRIGASGYALKSAGGVEFLRAVNDALRGLTYTTPQIAHIMEQRFWERPRELSEGQREVLHMLAEGRTTKEIAYILQISPRTLRSHKYRIMKELGISTNSQLVQ